MTHTTESREQAAARVARAGVIREPVSVPELAAAVQDRAAGAVVTFEGVVRGPRPRTGGHRHRLLGPPERG